MTRQRSRKNKILFTVCVLAVYELLLAVTLFLQIRGIPSELCSEAKHLRTLSAVENIVEANPRYTQLAFLGTHNSFSYDMKTSGKIVSENFNSKEISAMRLAKGVVVRYSVTQNVDITAQLGYGARLFDFRIAEVDGEYVCYHGVACSKIEVYFHQILEYLQEYKGEIVTIVLQETQLEDSNILEMYDYLFKVELNGKTLGDYVYYDANEKDISSLTYRDLTKGGEDSGIVVYSAGFAAMLAADARVYDSRNAPMWYDEVVPENNLNAIDAYLTSMVDDGYECGDKFYFIQAQTTFGSDTRKELWYSLKYGNLLGLARENNEEFISDARFEKWLSVVPSFWVDFINTDDFADRAMKIIMQKNRALCEGSAA